MSAEVIELRNEVEGLKAEVARLQQQLAETRAQRGEYMRLITELLPPDVPSEDEMREQMKNLIPIDDAMKFIRQGRAERQQSGS